MFAGIFKLPAGHALTVSDGQCQIRQYWDLTYRSRNPLDAPTLREELLELLDEAVRLRLVSDVPLGALLSGGIDSSLVVALMSRHVSSPVNTYSVGFSEPTLNELPYARLASERLNTNHHEIAVDTCTPDLLQRLIWHLDEPVADPAAVPTYLVCRLARETVTVVLTGEGGDELFAGYDYYGNRPWHSIRRLLPAGLNRRALPLAAATLNRVLGRKRYHDRTLWFLSLPENLQMIAWVAIFTDEALSTLCVPGLNGSGPSLAHSTFARLYDAHPEADDLQRLTYVDTKMWLPDDLLMKVDKMSMAASVEARCPFLDHHLTEFVANIPSALKRKDGVAKAILKEIAADILPPAIVARSKQTFDVPVGRWLTGSLRDVTLNAISEGIVPGGRFFSDEALRKLWRDVETDVPGAARQLWVLLNLRIWMHEYRVNLM
jgi:asparagine synthase (glutamine-hydrolysing)